MKATINIADKSYRIDLSKGCDISIPLMLNGEQPSVYNVPPAKARPYQDGNFIGDTRQGGSCNFDEITLVPHCNGTHTECVGHISHERISLHSVLQTDFIPATLITVESRPASDIPDTYIPAKNAEDRLLTRNDLAHAVDAGSRDFLQGLIIRTLPNPKSKMSRNYMSEPPPYFSIEAMRLINEIQIKHLLVDVPSVDRLMDEGKMMAHHIFWDIPEGSHEVDPENHSMKTITELVYVPDEIDDGHYFINLQFPNIAGDAAPSRPVLYQPLA